jgi:hypothetical protein
MKEYDFKGVIQAIAEAKPSHLALVSFLILPVVMNYWLETLLKAFPLMATSWKISALILLLLIYFFCLGWLVKENAHQKKLELKRDQIVGRLVSKGWTQIGFDTAKKAITKGATDNEIISIIEAFPKTLRYVQLRERDANRELVIDADGNQVYKQGVGLVSGGQHEVEGDM